MFFSLLSLGLPGGDQVDGLPPTASRKKHTFMLLLPKVIRGWVPSGPDDREEVGNTGLGSLGSGTTTDLNGKLRKFF